LNLCGLKRFFKMREKDESKQTWTRANTC
jgi:DNA-directed RNA polymerase subunit RPC12/RpoP